MSSETINLTVLGIPLTLKEGASAWRFREAIRMVEDRFADQVHRNNGRQTKEFMLTFMALGLADELIQLQKQQEVTGERLQRLLEYMEQSKNI